MRISDWSDVCSSDLVARIGLEFGKRHAFLDEIAQDAGDAVGRPHRAAETADQHRLARNEFGRGCGCGAQHRRRVVKRKSVSVRVELGGPGIMKKRRLSAQAENTSNNKNRKKS